MKNGKKPTVAQMQFLQGKGMTREQSKDYRVIKNTSDTMVLVHKKGGDPILIKK